MVHRDLELSRLTGARIHLLHLSTARSVELVRLAKADGVAVTAEAAPHHFTLTDEHLRGYDPVFKVNPPLRTADDVAAIKAGLADGTIDAIATDHAPHPQEDKERPIDSAPPGMLGLETALGVALAELDLPLQDVVAALSWKPAAIAGVSDRHGVPIQEGSPANLVVFDPTVTWSVRPGGTSPAAAATPRTSGGHSRARVRHTVFRGAPVVVDGQAAEMNIYTLQCMNNRRTPVLFVGIASQ